MKAVRAHPACACTAQVSKLRALGAVIVQQGQDCLEVRWGGSPSYACWQSFKEPVLRHRALLLYAIQDFKSPAANCMRAISCTRRMRHDMRRSGSVWQQRNAHLGRS